MTANWKVVRSTLVWLLIAIMTLGIVVLSPYAVKSEAASSKSSVSVVKKNGKWVAVRNGKIDTSVTGVYKNKNGWWRVEKGYVDFKANGIYKNENGWWKTTNGKVLFNETGVFKNEKGWWRVVNSKVDFNAQGIYKNSKGWWKTTNGRVTFEENGVFKNERGWWKVEKSKVNFGFDGVASNANGTWYLEGGKVRFEKNGTTKYNGKNYFIVNGKAVEASIMNKLIAYFEEDVNDTPFSKAIVLNTLEKEADYKKDISTATKITDPFYLRDDVLDRALDLANIDWANNAYLACAEFLLDDDAKPIGVSRELAKEILTGAIKDDNFGFTEAQAEAALKKLDADNTWTEQAEAAAKSILGDWTKNEMNGCSEAIYDDLMKELGFTDADAAAAKAKASKGGGYWKAQCKASAEEFKKEAGDDFTKENLEKYLLAYKFTENQVNNVVNEYFPSGK